MTIPTKHCKTLPLLSAYRRVDFGGPFFTAVSLAHARLPEGYDSMVAGTRGLWRLGRAQHDLHPHALHACEVVPCARGIHRLAFLCLAGES